MIISSTSLVNNPLLSVVIATYNQKLYIEQTVLSAINQNCNFDYEIVVADDGSNDGQREILKKLQEKYPEKLKLIFNEHNLMVTKNYVNAIREARGKYISTLDGDDIFKSEFILSKQVDALQKHTDVSLVHTGYEIFDNKTGKIIEIKNKWNSVVLNTKGIDSVVALLCDEQTFYPLGSSSCFYRNIYIEGCAKYFDLISNIGEGTLLNVTMSMAGKYYFIPEVLVSYRAMDLSLSHFGTHEEMLQYNFKYLKLKLVVIKTLDISECVINEILKKNLRQIKINAINMNCMEAYLDGLRSLKNNSEINSVKYMLENIIEDECTVKAKMLFVFLYGKGCIKNSWRKLKNILKGI